MGKYINQMNGTNLPGRGKAEFLLANGAKDILKPSEFRENLVCVVNNGSFEAAGYAYNEAEFKVFREPDGRPKRWFILENVESYV